jgi:hydrogenase maturation protease
MDRFIGGQGKRSVHEVGLMDLMSIARLADHLPPRRALVGIQPESLDWGEEPSDTVRAAIPEACRTVVRLVEEWNHDAAE